MQKLKYNSNKDMKNKQYVKYIYKWILSLPAMHTG